ncbi:MAG: hypothetical protein FJ128_00475 [Deltaproteobacteria bacterium]|nr:hypothetical protein [Deltaproteobacteria bacterium]
MDRLAKKAKEKDLEAKRILYAGLLENEFLNRGYDISVKVLGKESRTLKLKWVLMGRPLVHQLTNDGKLAAKWREMGFKKVIFTDGYRAAWDLTL